MLKRINFDNKKVKYSFKDNGNFIIENYNFSKPFSSFFPGIAGLYGIPIWLFYVNRGQCVSSFGINSKDEPILEYFPANKAYQMVFERCFRTFIKIKDKNKIIFYEPFQDSLNNLNFQRKNRMMINFSSLEIEEENLSLGLNIRVKYFPIPSDNFAGLARIISIENKSNRPRQVEFIDGLPVIAPYGLNNMFLKKMSRTIEAWMDVENLDNYAAFYRLKVEPADRPEVTHVQKGNFYLSFYKDRGKTSLVKPIVDLESIFSLNSDLSTPHLFLRERNFAYPKNQVTVSKTPCAFSFLKANIEKGHTFILNSIFGNMSKSGELNNNIRRIAQTDYLELKEKENKQIVNSIMKNAAVVSSFPAFDLYSQGTFLDNIIRGGLPITLDKGKGGGGVIYVYSRKHGDLERDYNRFVTSPTYFSQGNGNFRDINQNRRNDIFFNPELKDENILAFFNLIQLDGFNPLVVKGVSYHIENAEKISQILSDYLDDKNNKELVRSFLSKPFYIGKLFMFLEEHNIKIKADKNDFIKAVLAFSAKRQEAEHGEGYWTDHWAYNLDLLESFLGVYPEKLKEILIDKKEFTFYDDYWLVNPRSKKYILYHEKPRQLNALAVSKEKQLLIAGRKTNPHIVRINQGKGEIYKTNLLEKIICVIVNKLASLDPFGAGIEMEAGKPNWYDALNGLPALFGSSISETMELKRLVLWTKESLAKLGLSDNYNISLSEEIFDFYKGLNDLLLQNKDNNLKDCFDFWDKSYSLKESYREKTIFGISGQTKELNLSEFIEFLSLSKNKLDNAISKSFNPKDKTFATYFINEVVDFQRSREGKEGIFIKPLKFRQKPLPLFLEGFVHAFKVADGNQEKKEIFETVKKSSLYDSALRMYKVNASLENEPEEIGRARVFSPGWLENESIWLHMEYKYILEVLKSGLYDEFYSDFFKVLIPFQNPAKYGRSILENSSFLVSSMFADKKLHGNGFVARLSGSTSEFLHIWLLMNVGKNPFFLDDKGKLCLRFSPILHKDLFTKKKTQTIDKNCYAFNFLGNTLVVYHNPKRLNTFGKDCAKINSIKLEDLSGKQYEINSSIIPADYSNDVRCGKISRIDIYLS